MKTRRSGGEWAAGGSEASTIAVDTCRTATPIMLRRPPDLSFTTTRSPSRWLSMATTALPPRRGRDFDAALGQFKAGEYPAALALVNKAIQGQPSDAVMHEFRALDLFAMKDYSQAAATIHSVLAVGPGWDWATLSSLYPSVEIYTTQLRELEAYVRSNPNAANRPLPSGISLHDGSASGGGRRKNFVKSSASFRVIESLPTCAEWSVETTDQRHPLIECHHLPQRNPCRLRLCRPNPCHLSPCLRRPRTRSRSMPQPWWETGIPAAAMVRSSIST